jgi:hypothetical protein
VGGQRLSHYSFKKIKMGKLNFFSAQLKIKPGRFIYQQSPKEGPKQQAEMKRTPKKTPMEKKREIGKAEVRDKHGDSNLDKASFTAAKAKEILSTKEELSQYIKERRRDMPEEDATVKTDISLSEEKKDYPGDDVYLMLMALKSDPKALKDIISTHLESDQVNVASKAIELSENWEYILPADDDYFKELFNNPKAASSIRDKAFSRIQDESFKLTIVLSNIKSGDKFRFYWVQCLKEKRSYAMVLGQIARKSQTEQDNQYENASGWLKYKLDRMK